MKNLITPPNFKNKLTWWSAAMVALVSLSGFIAQPPAFLSAGLSSHLPVSRWNQLTVSERDSLTDADTLTMVQGFYTGLCNAMGDSVRVDITALPAPHAADDATLNNQSPARWGLSSFFNGRKTAGDAGNKYCFTFSEAQPVNIHSGEHRHFHGTEQIWVTAYDGLTPVNLSAQLNGPSTPATISGDGTPEVHFDANGQDGPGVWWSVSSDLTPVTTVCVEYYQNGGTAAGAEPFTIELANLNRCFFDDPLAAADPANPTPGAGITDSLVLTKSITGLAPGTVSGQVLATLQLSLENSGTATLDSLYIVDDLADVLPGSTLDSVISYSINGVSSASVLPTLNPGFDGISQTNLLDGISGSLAPGESLAIDVQLALDANEMASFGRPANAAFATGRTGGTLASATSDAPAGTPGDTGGGIDPTPFYLPSVNLSKLAYSPTSHCNLTAGNVEVQLELTIANSGNTTLQNIQLTDALAAQLGSAFVAIKTHPFISNSTATVNPSVVMSFNGNAGNDQIFDGTGGTLEPGQSIEVTMIIELDPDAAGAPANLSNQAVVSCEAMDDQGNALPALYNVSDSSDHGDDPLSNNPGFAGDTGGSDDATLLNLPSVLVSRNIAGVQPAASGTFGNFEAIIETIVFNTGNVPLQNLQLNDAINQASNLGSTFVKIASQPVIADFGAHGTPSNATTDPDLNPAFTGIGDLLNGGGQLDPGQSLVIQYTVEVNPDAAGAPAFPKTVVTAIAEGENSNGQTVSVQDLSDSGFEPTNNANWPGNTGSHCDPTPLGNCWSELSNGLSCNTNVQVSLDQNCVAGLEAPMILEGEPEPCADNDLLPLGNYFDLIVTTNTGVIVPDGNPATPNTYEIDGSYANQTLTVKVTDAVYGNNCWGYITIKDKLAPVIDCQSPVVVACNTALSELPPPSVTDNCDPNPTLTMVGEQIIDNEICDDDTVRIQRIFRAEDNMGNASGNCAIVYALARTNISFPQDIVWHCEQYAAFPGIVEPNPLNPGIADSQPADPDIDVAAATGNNLLAATGSGIIGNTGFYCGYVVSHSDAVTSSCGNSFRITRTWTVIDWCTGTVILSDGNGNDNVQYINVSDLTAPTLSVALDTLNANLLGQHPNYCASTGLLPAPQFSDGCNDVTIQIITPVGEADYVNGVDGKQGGFIPAPGLGIGTHTITYVATDACNNQTSIQVPVTVIDTETPQPACDGITDVAISSSGYATVFAQTFDDGTIDNCCIDHFEVRRMDDPCDDGEDDTVFGPSVTFCCEDAGEEVMVIFRAFDCFGNYNDCMVSVQVNDKIGVVNASCPPSQRITCNWYQDNLEAALTAAAGDDAQQDNILTPHFGTPTFLDNCSFDVLPSVTINLDQCGEGSIVRTWTAADPSGNQPASCTQTIFVDHVSDWVVSFPPHLEFDCMDLLPDFGEPQIFYGDCEMIAVSYEDEIFNTVPDACYKIVRKYTVINWCVVGAEVDQEVVEQPESELGLPFPACDLDGDGDCDERTFRDSWRSGPVTNRPTAAQATNTTGPDTDPDSDPWDGVISFEQVIKISDTTDPVFTVGCEMEKYYVDTTCVATVLLEEPLVKDCSSIITVETNSDLGAGLGPFTNVPPGTYNVTFTAYDNCNNSASCSNTIVVMDTIKPTPFCLNGLVIELMVLDTPMVSIHPQDFDKQSFDNCAGPLQYSFSANVDDTVRTYFCEDVGIQPIEMWVTDQYGNQDFCTTTIEVQANMGQCSDTLVVDVGGAITTEDDNQVEGVNVDISGQWNGASVTSAGGLFIFENVPLGQDITITPEKDDDPVNGVSTFDLVKISRHILGVELLDSPYKIIAADANRSKSVTSFDLVELRRLILSIYTELPQNTSWRFVPKDFSFPNPANPFETDFPEVININNLPANVSSADFVAIKVGDVNGSAAANNLQSIEERNFAGELLFELPDERFAAGEVIEVPFRAKDFAVSGFQFSLYFDADQLEFIELKPGLAAPSNFGFTQAERGIIPVSWNESKTVKVDDGTELFTLRFRSLRNGSLRNVLNIQHQPTPAEAYAESNGQLELLDVNLVFANGLQTAPELYANVPNPFRKNTTISFFLPENTTATLTFIDASGRPVKVIQQDYDSGTHELTVTKDELGGAGVYYYRLETPGTTAVRRMVVLD
ncbi:MAG: hypothetical protein Kow0027_17490 [Saprospiraceae bacterium]